VHRPNLREGWDRKSFCGLEPLYYHG
jgi:hypothetical protein